MANSEQPHWHGMQGVRRVQSEFRVSLQADAHMLIPVLHASLVSVHSKVFHPGTKCVMALYCSQNTHNILDAVKNVLQYLTNKVNKGEWPQMKDLTIVGDDINRWRFKLYNFDNDMEGGRNLNDDLNVRFS